MNWTSGTSKQIRRTKREVPEKIGIELCKTVCFEVFRKKSALTSNNFWDPNYAFLSSG